MSPKVKFVSHRIVSALCNSENTLTTERKIYVPKRNHVRFWKSAKPLTLIGVSRGLASEPRKVF